METRLPFYLAYPAPLAMDDERRERMDFEYMKSMYPDAAKKLLPYVEEECDRMEFEGSMVFDEYPDRLQLMLMVRRVFRRVKQEKVFSDEIFAGKESGEWLAELIQVLLYQELYKRRSDYRKYKRKFYAGL